LNQKFPILQMHELIDIVSRAFSSNLSDGNVELVEWSPSEGLEEERDSLPGLYEIYRQLKCREWIFGRTPKFELDILDSRRMEESPDEDIVLVEHGRIKESNHSQFPVGEQFHTALMESKVPC